MQESSGPLASGNRYHVSPDLLQVTDATGTPLATVARDDIRSVTQSVLALLWGVMVALPCSLRR